MTINWKFQWIGDNSGNNCMWKYVLKKWCNLLKFINDILSISCEIYDSLSLKGDTQVSHVWKYVQELQKTYLKYESSIRCPILSRDFFLGLNKFYLKF